MKSSCRRWKEGEEEAGVPAPGEAPGPGEARPPAPGRPGRVCRIRPLPPPSDSSMC